MLEDDLHTQLRAAQQAGMAAEAETRRARDRELQALQRAEQAESSLAQSQQSLVQAQQMLDQANEKETTTSRSIQLVAETDAAAANQDKEALQHALDAQAEAEAGRQHALRELMAARVALEAQQQRETDLQHKVAALNAAHGELQQQRTAWEQQQAALAATLAQARLEESATAQEHINAADLQRRLQALLASKIALEQQLAQAEAAGNEVMEESSALCTAVADAERRAGEQASELQRLQAALDSVPAERAQWEASLVQQQRQIAQLEHERDQVTAIARQDAAAQGQSIARLQAEHAALQREASNARAEMAAMALAAERASQHSRELAAAQDRARDDLHETATLKVQALQQDVAELTDERAQLQSLVGDLKHQLRELVAARANSEEHWQAELADLAESRDVAERDAAALRSLRAADQALFEHQQSNSGGSDVGAGTEQARNQAHLEAMVDELQQELAAIAAERDEVQQQWASERQVQADEMGRLSQACDQLQRQLQQAQRSEDQLRMEAAAGADAAQRAETMASALRRLADSLQGELLSQRAGSALFAAEGALGRLDPGAQQQQMPSEGGHDYDADWSDVSTYRARRAPGGVEELFPGPASNSTVRADRRRWDDPQAGPDTRVPASPPSHREALPRRQGNSRLAPYTSQDSMLDDYAPSDGPYRNHSRPYPNSYASHSPASEHDSQGVPPTPPTTPPSLMNAVFTNRLPGLRVENIRVGRSDTTGSPVSQRRGPRQRDGPSLREVPQTSAAQQAAELQRRR